jgi:hypothetical protein
VVIGQPQRVKMLATLHRDDNRLTRLAGMLLEKM